ncbi:MAG TPA: hypothetical protein VKD72_30080, partial [Gemmataceae bacterium]|nr:hypothetical protein [Gemmataceae bacterium]
MDPTRRSFVAASIAAALPAAAGAGPAARLIEPKKAEVMTFEDLFHLTPKDAERVVGAAKVKQMQSALQDFTAALAYKAPVHAKWKESLRDGGTTTYEGDGYTLVVSKSLTALEAKEGGTIDGYDYGPSL